MKNVLVDLDGVVINLLEGIRLTLAAQGVVFNPDGVTGYDFYGDFGCDRSVVLDLLNHKDIYDRAVFYDGAEEALNKLKLVANIQVYSSCPVNPFVMTARQSLIKTLGLNGEFYIGEKPVITGFDALFEDCPRIIHKYEEVNGTDVYVIDHTYNINEEFSEKCKRFPSFCESVISFCEKL